MPTFRGSGSQGLRAVRPRTPGTAGRAGIARRQIPSPKKSAGGNFRQHAPGRWPNRPRSGVAESVSDIRAGSTPGMGTGGDFGWDGGFLKPFMSFAGRDMHTGETGCRTCITSGMLRHVTRLFRSIRAHASTGWPSTPRRRRELALRGFHLHYCSANGLTQQVTASIHASDNHTAIPQKCVWTTARNLFRHSLPDGLNSMG